MHFIKIKTHLYIEMLFKQYENVTCKELLTFENIEGDWASGCH